YDARDRIYLKGRQGRPLQGHEKLHAAGQIAKTLGLDHPTRLADINLKDAEEVLKDTLQRKREPAAETFYEAYKKSKEMGLFVSVQPSTVSFLKMRDTIANDKIAFAQVLLKRMKTSPKK